MSDTVASEENVNVSDTKQKLELQTNIQKVSACERHICVTVPRTDVERYFADEYGGLVTEAEVPGFRKGKAPRLLVEKRFRREVAERVKNALVIDALSQVNESGDITPISEPDFDYNSLILPDAGPFVFEFDIEVRPEFAVPEWRGLVIEKPVREFTKEDVDKAVQRILASYGDLEPIDTPAEKDDYIVAKIEFKDGDEVLSEIEEETIRIRSVLSLQDGTIGNFNELMIGAKAGNTIKTELTLSKDAPNEDNRGKTVTAVFTIKEVKRLVTPELTSEFLEKLGDFETEGDFRDGILDTLKRHMEHEQHQKTRRQITGLLTESASWELPPNLLAKQSEREFRRSVLELRRNGYSDEEILSQKNFLRQNSAIETAQALKEHFILEKIAEVENIDAAEEDYVLEIELIAAQNNSSPRRVRAQLEKAGEMDILRNQIIERKVIELISENAKFKETPFEFEDKDEEALDWAAGGFPKIAEATEEDLKAVNREIAERKMINPNAKVT
ncbi:MAG: trigger factor [Planctomycetaceae bacterium]|nr:trigger factor [Planctomycetaceae bacterium]